MRRLILFMLSTGIFLYAGLTDFKTIKEANQAYEAKEYAKSAALLNSLDAKSPQKQQGHQKNHQERSILFYSIREMFILLRLKQKKTYKPKV